MLIIAIGRLTQFALLLLTLRAATEFLSPAEMGKVSIVAATVAFFALLLINPVGMFMNRRMHAWETQGLIAEHYAYFWRYLFLVNVCAAITLAALNWFDIWRSSIEIHWFIFLVCGNLIFATLNQLVIPGLNMFGFRGWFAFLNVATVAMSLTLAVLLVHAITPVAEYWLSGLLIGQMCVGLMGKRVLYKKLNHVEGKTRGHVKLTQSNVSALVMYAWPVAIAVGLGWVQSQGYRYWMESQLGLAELGLFVAGFGISAGLISGIESILSTYSQPKFYKSLENNNLSGNADAWVEYAQAIVPAMLLTTVFIIATASELTQMFLGENFAQSAQFVIWGAAAELGRVATAAFSMAAHARMNTKTLLLPNLVGATGIIVMLSLLVPLYGSMGVGIAIVLASVTSLIISAILTKTYLNMTLPLKIFVKSALMGAGLWVLAAMIKQGMSNQQGIVKASIILCVIGVYFILCQYFLLRPSLKDETSARAAN